MLNFFFVAGLSDPSIESIRVDSGIRYQRLNANTIIGFSTQYSVLHGTIYGNLVLEKHYSVPIALLLASGS